MKFLKRTTILVIVFMMGWFVSLDVTTSQVSNSKQEQFKIDLALCQQAIAKDVPDKCKLFGKIKFVDHFPDVKVKIVDHFPDIKVKQVKNFADKPGLWKIVDNFPDYKVQIVDHFPDYKIKYVKHFPGCEGD